MQCAIKVYWEKVPRWFYVTVQCLAQSVKTERGKVRHMQEVTVSVKVEAKIEAQFSRRNREHREWGLEVSVKSLTC